MLLVLNRREEPQLSELLVGRARRSKFGERREVIERGRSILEQVGDEREAHGRAEGEARGRAEGEARGVRQALVTVLERRFGPLPAEVEAAVERSDVATMSEWLAIAATAASLEEVGIRSLDI